MGDYVESFGEIHNGHVNLGLTIEGLRQVLCCKDKLRFARVLSTETMLFVSKDIMCAEVSHDV